MKWKGKTILVTGSSSGIGKATAIACSREGAHVLIHYHRNEQGALETLKEVENNSSGNIYSANLTEISEVKELFKKCKQNNSTIDMLVNNAGAASSGDFDDISMWENQWKNILMSQVYVTNEFINFMTSDDLRKILNVSSIYGDSNLANPDFPQYSAMKAAVSNFTCTLAKKFSPKILVNAVAPGYTLTAAWEGVLETTLAQYSATTRIKRFIQADEIASTIIAILQNDAITGEIIRVDGGLHLSEML
ncbi:MAG TPA: SDR family oxidoreductase [Candidatus Saccharimonadales bacterium]|nr:SDR family oxidoreductase [Candidatus Saccharimonadales bacterium]